MSGKSLTKNLVRGTVILGPINLSATLAITANIPESIDNVLPRFLIIISATSSDPCPMNSVQIN